MRKIPTLYVRDFTRDNGRYVTGEVTPGCEWVLQGIGTATRKFDGTCVMVDDQLGMWARREVKRGKATPPGFVAVETDETTGKTVGWEPAHQSSFAKLLAAVPQPTAAGTFELVGPKVNGNPEGCAEHALVPHGAHPLSIDRTREGIVGYLRDNPSVEGIVFWERWGYSDLDQRLAKIKRRDLPELSSSRAGQEQA